MRLLTRFALAAAAAALTACSNGSGGALPFSGPPNNAGGTGGQFQGGSGSIALLRFVQGSPDYAAVDVCIDNIPFGVTQPSVSYGNASASLYAVAGGITHTVAVFPSLGGAMDGLECPTAPGPYLGTSTISVTTIGPGTGGTSPRETIVLGGTAASKTLALYVFGEPTFATAPGTEAIAHNAAPAFSAVSALKSVGFGFTPAGGVPTTLPGAQSVPAPLAATATSSAANTSVVAPLSGTPTSFYAGAGSAGTVAPIATVPAPAAIGGPYVTALYAVDASGGTLSLVAVQEQTVGFGF